MVSRSRSGQSNQLVVATQRDNELTSEPGEEPGLLDVLSPQQAQILIDSLPKLQPEAREITDLVSKWSSSSGGIPVGLGGDGKFAQFVEIVDPTLIWVNPELYVVGARAESEEISEEDWTRLVNSYKLLEVRNEYGVSEQFSFVPVLLIRRENPNDPGQNKMLLRGLTQYKVAKHLNRGLPAIVYSDMPDRALHAIGVHAALSEDPPSRREVIRHLFEMDLFTNRPGRPSADSTGLTFSQLGDRLGCSKSLLSKMYRVYGDPWMRNQVFGPPKMSPRVAYKALVTLPDAAERESAVQQILRQQLTAAEAEQLIMERARQLKSETSTYSDAMERSRDSLIQAARVAADNRKDMALALGGDEFERYLDLIRQAVDILAKGLAENDTL